MKNNNPPEIRINSVGERYVATFESEFLDATYALVFRETVNGAVALHRFAKMIEREYGRTIKFHINDDLPPMKSRLAADIFTGIGVSLAGRHKPQSGGFVS